MRHVFTLLLIAPLLMVSPMTALTSVPYESMEAVVHERMDSFWFGHRATASETTRTINVAMQGARFVPADIIVKRGETVRFVVTNRDGIAHEFVLGDAAEQAAHEKEMASMPGMPMDDPNGITVAPGATKTLAWTFTRTGKIQYACHLPGHYDGGMVGYLSIHE